MARKGLSGMKEIYRDFTSNRWMNPFFPFFWWAKLQDAPQNDRKIM